MKRVFKVLIVIFIIWLGITFYFITQHTVETKEAKLNQTVVFNDVTIKLDNIVFYNFKRKELDFKTTEFKYKLSSKLPELLVRPYLRLNYLYSTPYKIDNQLYQVALSGKCILTPHFNESMSYFNYFKEHVSITVIDSNGVSYSSGNGLEDTDNRQELDFSIKGQNFPIERLQDGVKVIIKHLESGEEKEYKIESQDFIVYKHNDSFGNRFSLE